MSEEHTREIVLAYWIHTIWTKQRKAQAPNILNVRALHEAMLFFHRELRQNGLDVDFGLERQSGRYLKIDSILEKFTKDKIFKKALTSRAEIREFEEPNANETGTPSAGKRLENIFNPQGESRISRDEKTLLDKAYAHAMGIYFASIAQYPPPHPSERHASS